MEYEPIWALYPSIYLKARIRIRICNRFKVKGRIRIRIRIKVISRVRIRIRNTVSKSFFIFGPRYKIFQLAKPGSKSLLVFAISVLILNQRRHRYAVFVFLSLYDKLTFILCRLEACIPRRTTWSRRWQWRTDSLDWLSCLSAPPTKVQREKHPYPPNPDPDQAFLLSPDPDLVKGLWQPAPLCRGDTTEMNANRFFWDSHWLEIWANQFCSFMWPNWGSVAMDSEDFWTDI